MNFLKIIIVFLICLGTACGSKTDDTSSLRNRPVLNHIIACTLDQTVDYQDSFNKLNYAITGIQMDTGKQTANMIIHRSDKRPQRRERTLASYYFAQGALSRSSSHVEADWNNGNRIELEKSAQGYQGRVTVNNDVSFNISCQDSVSKPVRETYQCFPITDHPNIRADQQNYYARRFVINIYDDNDVSLRVITGRNMETKPSFLIEQGLRQMRRNMLGFSWTEQKTNMTLNTNHPKYRGKASLFQGTDIEIECLRRL